MAQYRHEYKHLLSMADYYALKMRLGAIMQRDVHAGATGEYRIRSLYFDNYFDKALNEKIDGVNDREKFRLRTYNGERDVVMLEKKSKRAGLSMKRQARITPEEAEKMIAGDAAWMRLDGRDLVLELYSKLESELLRPKVIVDYIREPYTFAAGNVRVTIDRDIRTGIKCTDFFKDISTVSASGEIILEIKYDEYLPDIVKMAVQLGERNATAFSKYAACRIYG